MFTKKEKRLVGEGFFTIIRETKWYIEFLSNSTKRCWIICKNPNGTDKPVMIYLDLLTIGLVLNIWTEKANDDVKYKKKATQGGFDKF